VDEHGGSAPLADEVQPPEVIDVPMGDQNGRQVLEPFCSASSFISPAWGETNDGLLPASSTHGS
jgi:hypothetical protein